MCVCVFAWKNSELPLIYYFSFPPPQAPVISSHLSDETVIAGRSVTFRCHLAGVPHPLPNVEWSHDGARLTIDRAFSSFGEEKCVLRINEVEEGDDGTYTCTVTNSEGVATSTAQLCVISESIINSPTHQVSIFLSFNWGEPEHNFILDY